MIPQEAELYVVSSHRLFDLASDVRDRMNQAVLFIDESAVPLDTTEVDELLSDQEFQRLVSTFGVGVDLSRFWQDRHPETFELEKLRYHKILLLADDGPKGARVREQLLTWLFLYFHPVLDSGHAYLFEEMPSDGIAKAEFEDRFMRSDRPGLRKVVPAGTLSETLALN